MTMLSSPRPKSTGQRRKILNCHILDKTNMNVRVAVYYLIITHRSEMFHIALFICGIHPSVKTQTQSLFQRR